MLKLIRSLKRLALRLLAEWKLRIALDELATMQARSDVGPVYLCGLLVHITELDWQIADLKA